jgi:hypothetical protein
MSRRKNRKAKTTTRRRRRISGVNAKSPIVQLGSIAAGYFLGDTINDALSKVTGKLDPKIVAGIEALGGFLLTRKVKSLPGQLIGGVLMGAGVKSGLKEFGVIKGLPVVNGYRDMRAVSGLPAPVRRVAGLDGSSPSKTLSVINGIESAYLDTDR